MLKIKPKNPIDCSLNPTSFLRLSCPFNFETGTKLSKFFLEHYADSKSRNFILSEYKYLVKDKWDRYFGFFLTVFIINLCHAIFFSFNLYSVFKEGWNLFAFFIADLLIISLLILNEIIAYIALKQNYFGDFLNFFDISTITISILVLGFNYRDN